MREVKKSQVGETLARLLAEEHPEEEDIGILDEDGNLLGVVIKPQAYDFLLRKVEEAEDEMDNESVEKLSRLG